VAASAEEAVVLVLPPAGPLAKAAASDFDELDRDFLPGI